MILLVKVTRLIFRWGNGVWNTGISICSGRGRASRGDIRQAGGTSLIFGRRLLADGRGLSRLDRHGFAGPEEGMGKGNKRKRCGSLCSCLKQGEGNWSVTVRGRETTPPAPFLLPLLTQSAMLRNCATNDLMRHLIVMRGTPWGRSLLAFLPPFGLEGTGAGYRGSRRQITDVSIRNETVRGKCSWSSERRKRTETRNRSNSTYPVFLCSKAYKMGGSR